ncbi:unnamed protein product, partial [Linum tenue]
KVTHPHFKLFNNYTSNFILIFLLKSFDSSPAFYFIFDPSSFFPKQIPIQTSTFSIPSSNQIPFSFIPFQNNSLELQPHQPPFIVHPPSLKLPKIGILLFFVLVQLRHWFSFSIDSSPGSANFDFPSPPNPNHTLTQRREEESIDRSGRFLYRNHLDVFERERRRSR